MLDAIRQAHPPSSVDLWNKFQGTMPTILGELGKALNTPVQDAASVVQIAVSKSPGAPGRGQFRRPEHDVVLSVLERSASSPFLRVFHG